MVRSCIYTGVYDGKGVNAYGVDSGVDYFLFIFDNISIILSLPPRRFVVSDGCGEIVDIVVEGGVGGGGGEGSQCIKIQIEGGIE